MATNIQELPPGSQQSTSELSDPPEFTDDEMREIVVKMSPVTRQQSRNTPANEQLETNGVETSSKPSNGIDSSSNEDDMAPEIRVSPKATRRRVPSKRSLLSNSKPTASRQPAAKKPKTSTKKWEPNNVTQSSKSPLVNRDLRALLLHSQAWDLLTDEDKKEILALFPDNKHILDAGTPNARPNVIALQNDDNFRHDTEEYVANLSRGMHDPHWLQDAWAAHGSRAAGSFDKYYIRRLETDWKTTIPDEMKPKHLRSTPEPETSSVAVQPAGCDGAAEKQEISDSIVANGINGSANTEDDARTNGDVVMEGSNSDAAKGDAEDGSPETVSTAVDKAPGAKDDVTADVDGDKMRTSPE